jgi:tetratricopeptide (TPR) repeat protein
MFLSNRRASVMLVLVLLSLVGAPLQSAHAADDFNRYLRAAVRLYESLDYERALKQLERARRVARGVEEDVILGLHEGIILADMGRWQDAQATFKTALLLNPEAKLPLRVSPKVEAEFEKQRERARQELARMQGQEPQKAATAATGTPGKKPGQKPASTPPVVATPGGTGTKPEAPPVVASTDRPEQKTSEGSALVPSTPPSAAFTPTVETRSRRLPVVPLALAGTGVVAGGLATYFGLASRGQVTAAREAEFQDELISNHQAARRSATTANILVGTAGLALAGAVVTWFLMPADAATASGETR